MAIRTGPSGEVPTLFIGAVLGGSPIKPFQLSVELLVREKSCDYQKFTSALLLGHHFCTTTDLRPEFIGADLFNTGIRQRPSRGVCHG